MGLHLGQESRELESGDFRLNPYRPAGARRRGSSGDLRRGIARGVGLLGNVLFGQKSVEKALIQHVGRNVTADNPRRLARNGYFLEAVCTGSAFPLASVPEAG